MDKQFLEFQEITKPLIQYINENYNPHTIIVIENDRAKLLSTEKGFNTNEFIED